MKAKLKTVFGLGLLVSFVILSSLTLDAQSVSDETELRDMGADIQTHKATGVAEFVRFPRGSELRVDGEYAEAISAEFLREYGSIFGIADVDAELTLIDTTTDQHGYQRTTYHQTYQGIPVWGAKLHVHLNPDNMVSSSNGVFIPDISVDTLPQITAEAAGQIASSTVASQTEMSNIFGESTPLVTPISESSLTVHANELVIFHTGLLQGQAGQPHLAYEIEIRGRNIREFLFVDAVKGTVLDGWTGVHSALDRELYTGTAVPGNLIWSEGDALPGILGLWENSAIVTAGESYHFFNNAFGRDSYDNNGATMVTVYDTTLFTGICPNAFWYLGETHYCIGLATDDIVAHEWAHAYTEYTSNLIYAWQPGALNEAYSDIWGETVDLLNSTGLTPGDVGDDILRTDCNNSIRWKEGEDALIVGGPIRDMWDPTCNNDPGKVSDTEYFCDSDDSGGVHSNSGIPNHVYALLVDGGTYNGQTINALDFTKAAHIFWRAQETYLTPTSDFAVFGSAIQQSCQDLIGIDLEGLSLTATPAGLSGEIITAADCQQVAAAALATELTLEPTQCNFQSVLEQNPPLLTCTEGKREIELVEDFEAGLGGFTVGNMPSNPLTWTARDWVVTTAVPGGRTGQVAFGIDPSIGDCSTDLENGVIYMTSPTIQFLPNSSEQMLTFDHYVATEFSWDGGTLEVSVNGGAFTQVPASAFAFNPYNSTLRSSFTGNDNPLAGLPAFTGLDEGSVGGSWGTSHVDLQSLGVTANDTIQLRWQMGTDSCTGLDGWYVDDVSVTSCNVPMAVSLGAQEIGQETASTVVVTAALVALVTVTGILVIGNRARVMDIREG